MCPTTLELLLLPLPRCRVKYFMTDTNLVEMLLRTVIEKQTIASNTWALIIAALLTGLPPTLAAIMAYIKAASAERNTVETKHVNVAQALDLKEIHTAVNSGKTALEKRIEVLDGTVLDLSKKLATALEFQRGKDQAKDIAAARLEGAAVIEPNKTQ